MPIRKVWRESRSRFFFILAALLLVTAATVFYNGKAERVVIESKDFHAAGERTIRGVLFMFWSFSALFLGLGGFLRERAVGTVDYTLSLPVSRNRWFLYRSLTGALQSMAAALIPALAIPVIAAVSGGDFPVGDALLLGLRMGLGGMRLDDLTDEQRAEAGLSKAAMALKVRHLGEFVDHAVAKRAGLRRGDVIVACDGREGRTSESELLAYTVQRKRPGDDVSVTVLREGERKRFRFALQ